MLFAMIAKDKPGSVERRLAVRPRHLQHLDGLGQQLRLVLPHPEQLRDDPGGTERQSVLRVVLVGRDQFAERFHFLGRAGILPGEHRPDRHAVRSHRTGDRPLCREADGRDFARVDAGRGDRRPAGLHRPRCEQLRILLHPAGTRIGGTIITVVPGHRGAIQVEDHAPCASRPHVDTREILRHIRSFIERCSAAESF